MSYYIGQIFEGKYPPEAACWCNSNRAFIEKVGTVTKTESEDVRIAGVTYINGEESGLYGTKQIEKVLSVYKIVAVPEPTPEELEAQALANAKAERAAEVEALTVEVEGMVFDADETSQARMSVAASSMTDDETNVWVLADNTIVQVTKAHLMQACRLARIAQSAVWTKPYEAS